ncbi:MAG: tetratricopeptide repeat protein [Bacteroidetes bacterium]|nr:tetratricopeptide repeat protein [Bacteroidota bacterium]
MTRKEIEERYQTICSLVFMRRLKPAIDDLEKLLRYTVNADYYYQLENLTENYKTLLRYAFDGYHDMQQNSILNGLYTSVLTLVDEIRQTLVNHELQYRKYQKNSLLAEFGAEPQLIAARIESLFFNRTVDILIEETVPGNEGYSSSHPLKTEQIDRIFKSIWLTGKMNAEYCEFIRRIIHSTQIEWHEKCAIVSALTLSILNQFDAQKLMLLMEFAEARENQVYQRALTGLIIALIINDKRLIFYPAFVEKLKKFRDDDAFLPEVEFIIMQFLMARETDKITREFEEEVLPEMKKMIPRIEDKLQLNDLADDEELEGKNPKWKDMIEEVPGLFEKIEKFSRMQMEGGDVFMSTFRLLKRFDFFNSMSNWFVPFHRNHPEIVSGFYATDSINSRLLESLDKAFYICNSDKYSFALNFKAIPDHQRSMIVTNFEAEFAHMTEMATEEQLLDKSISANAVFIQYIQDLYRFFKLFPAHHEFDDVFQQKIRLTNLYFYNAFFERPGFTEKTASFHFEKEHYAEAVEVYEDLIKAQGPNGEYFERTGFCYQKSGKYSEAVNAYKKAELFDGNRLWLMKKLGWCYLKLKDYQNALTCFLEAATLQPDEINLQLQVGQCYLNLKAYSEALHQYLKTSFFAPDNLKALRPIAYCQFVLEKPEQANETYSRILTAAPNPSAYDLMNAAHVRLCLGQRKEALNLYRQCFLQNSPSRSELLDAFDEDVQHLVKNGIPAEEIPLIRDFLIFHTES